MDAINTKTITLDYDTYLGELSSAKKEGYYTTIRTKVEENKHYQTTMQKLRKADVQIARYETTLRDEWDKAYIAKKRIELLEDRKAIYKFLSFLFLILLLFSEVIKEWLL